MNTEYSYNAPQFYANLDEVIVSEDEDDFFDAKDSKVKLSEEGKKTAEMTEECSEDDGNENKENIVLLPDEEDVLNDSFSKIKIKSNKFDGIDIAVDDDRKSHPMLTRQDVSILSPKLSLQLRSRSVLKDVLVTEESRQSKKRKAGSSSGQGNSVAKYRSLSEAIYHFHRDTPPRFRTQSKKSVFKFPTDPKPSTSRTSVVTVPDTPHFLSENRLRHCTHHELSREERELLEIKEAKEHFKPQELNKKIFDPPKEIDREKKFTVPKPFNLTNPPPKKVVEEKKNEVFVFKAKPVPRKTYSQSMTDLRVSTNRLPVLMEECEDGDIYSKVVGFKEAQPRCTTKIEPFSFDERDKLKAMKKEETIKKIIESEKKMASFKAQPLPSYLHSDGNDFSSSSSSSSHHHRHEIEEFNPEFKARPAIVLKKKPFQAKKSEKPPTKFLDICLQTEIRAHQRQEFEQQKKLNEESIEHIKAQIAQNELEEIQKLRKELVHKPLPLPKFLRKHKSTSNEELDGHNETSEENEKYIDFKEEDKSEEQSNINETESTTE